MNDIIITTLKDLKFKKGFLPENGQKIFAKCPDCGFMHEIKLGQGEVCSDNICTNCKEYLGDCWATYQIFPQLNIYFAYSKKKFTKKFNKNDDELDDNKKFTIAVCNITGEAHFEGWDVSDKDLYDIADCMNRKINMGKFDQIERVITHKDDREVLLYLYSKNVDMTKVYVIDDNFNVKQIDKIEVSILFK